MQSMSARAHSESVTPVQQLTAPEPADLVPIDLAKIDLVKIDLVKIDLVLTNLGKPAPTHSAQPAPFACRSHRQVCHRSAGSKPLESAAHAAEPVAVFESAVFESDAFGSDVPAVFDSLFLVNRGGSSSLLPPSLPARLPLFDCPSVQRFPGGK